MAGIAFVIFVATVIIIARLDKIIELLRKQVRNGSSER